VGPIVTRSPALRGLWISSYASEISMLFWSRGLGNWLDAGLLSLLMECGGDRGEIEEQSNWIKEGTISKLEDPSWQTVR